MTVIEESPGDFSFACNNAMVVVNSQWSLQRTVTQGSPNDIIVPSPVDSSQSNNHGGFTDESPNDTHLKVLLSRINCIAFCFNVVAVTLVTICYVTLASHRLTMLLKY